MNKKLLYWIVFIIISLVSIFPLKQYYSDYVSSADFLHPISVEYLDYKKERDFTDIDNLMEKYKFWLFHGDYKKGECPLYPNFEKLTHVSDFDLHVDVPYGIKVARIDGRSVGFITYYISENKYAKADEPKKIGRIHLVCVEENYRRLGIAKRLIEDVMNFFKENNCQKAYLVTRPENIRAKGLYYKLGFNEMNNQENNVFDKNPADVLLKIL